ncbi:MAG: rod shape-determining protein MreC, partial [Wenzhouxiangellaceae bacterium]
MLNTGGRPEHPRTAAGDGGTARLMFYALLAISLMALDYRGQYVEQARGLAEQLAEPVFWLVDLPFVAAHRTRDVLSQRLELQREIDALEMEIAHLRARLLPLADLRIENDRLRQALATAERMEYRPIAAELSSIDLDPFAHRVMIRRGRIHGVKPGMPVIDDRGVLGQIERVQAARASLILISDPDHALPVQILPAGERTIAYGSGSLDRLRLTDLPMNTEIVPGSLVVTSGIGGRFPPGLPVARIVSVERPPGQPFAHAEAVPLA